MGNDCSISYGKPNKNDLKYLEGRRERGKKKEVTSLSVSY